MLNYKFNTFIWEIIPTDFTFSFPLPLARVVGAQTTCGTKQSLIPLLYHTLFHLRKPVSFDRQKINPVLKAWW